MEAIIFIGIQATGKSTFYTQKFFKTHVRISMDLLNTRNKEKRFLETCHSVQQRYVIDNTNPSIEERSGYIKNAKLNKFKIIGYYFQSKLNEAITRNSNRTGKENISEIGIKGTFNRLELPSYGEGFDELYYVELTNNGFIVKSWQNEI
ncbi:MAG TPA: ATP-binding protein [Bacteroidia bacterium]|jgi:predicted kinase|nr:ATP-binding protein [Bacteroidia bacterium]